MGILYVVATPIGNLDDITARALETLKGVDLIISEDTRVARKLLSHFGIDNHVDSYHQHSSYEKQLYLLKLLLEGQDIALITDAGTPGISDPGNELIEFLVNNSTDKQIRIVPVPGPSSAVAALSVCGFDVSKHLFIGFWPKKKALKVLKLIKENAIPFVYFDSPHRVVKNLEKIYEELGEKRIFVGRELTKVHETQYRGAISEVLSQLKTEKFLKGEIVVVVE